MSSKLAFEEVPSNKATHPVPIFRIAVSPTQSGFASEGVFWNVPVSFKDCLYNMAADGMRGLQVVRSEDGKDWEFASTPLPGDTRYNNIWHAFVYQDHLYISLNQDRCTDPQIQTPGLVMRTADGKNWELVFQTSEVDGLTAQTGQFGAHNRMLYLTTLVGFGQTGTAQIWRSRSGDPDTWQLATPAFGNNLDFASPIISFKGYAYCSGHDAQGMHIWHSANGVDWETVGEDVLTDPEYTNWWGSDLVIFNDTLYLGTNPWFYWIFDSTKYMGGQLHRSMDGVHWNLVVERGFGSLNPSGIDCLIAFHDQLYAFSNDLAGDRSSSFLNIWRSPTGNPGDWVKMNPDDLGANLMVTKSDLAIFKDRLYFGNQYGSGAGIYLIEMSNP